MQLDLGPGDISELLQKYAFHRNSLHVDFQSKNDMVAAKFGRQAISRMNWSPEAKLNICTDTPPFLGRRFKENVTFLRDILKN